MTLVEELQRQLSHFRDPRIITYLRSARDYADPHPDLTAEQLRVEMRRIRSTLDAVLEILTKA